MSFVDVQPRMSRRTPPPKPSPRTQQSAEVRSPPPPKRCSTEGCGENARSRSDKCAGCGEAGVSKEAGQGTSTPARTEGGASPASRGPPEQEAVFKPRPPPAHLARRLQRLNALKDGYKILEYLGLTFDESHEQFKCLTGDKSHDAKLVLERRNQMARLFMPKIYNPAEKHRKQFMRHMAMINEAYSLILKSKESRDAFKRLMQLRNYYEHFVVYGRRREKDNMEKLCVEAEKLGLAFREMHFPIRPIQEVKLASKILCGMKTFADILFLVEQSHRMTSQLNEGIRHALQASLTRISPGDSVGLALAMDQGTSVLCELAEARQNVRFAQKIHMLNSETGDEPSVCRSVCSAITQLEQKGRWVSKWLVCVFASESDVSSNSYVHMVTYLRERQELALSIVGIMLDGKASQLFTRLSTQFPPKEGCNLRFHLLMDRNIDFSFTRAMEMVKG